MNGSIDGDNRDRLCSFLQTIARPGVSIANLQDDTNLFDHGALDSLAVIQIILYLEREYHVNLGARGIDPAQLGSIEGILNAIAQGTR
ncbi:MAG TPA: acyl carrier protein [Chromatiales bacterium]|nr:acyl carrier protein [Chromatiales bacterium]